MLTAEVLSGFIGLFMPYVVDLVKYKLPKLEGPLERLPGVIASILVSVVVGTLSAVAEGQVTPSAISYEGILSAIGVSMIAAQASYNTWFKGLGVDDRFEERFKK